MQRGGGGVGEEGVKEAMVWQTQAGSNARAARAEAVEQLKQRGWTHAQLTAPIARHPLSSNTIPVRIAATVKILGMPEQLDV